MKNVFISHPFAGDIEGNRAKAYALLEFLHNKYPDIIFISPIHTFSYMKGETPEQREVILQMCFKLIDICEGFWLFGESDGCKKEFRYAFKNNKNILIDPLRDEFEKFLNTDKHICDECNQVFFLDEPLERYEGYKRNGPFKKVVCPGCLVVLRNN